MDVLMVLDDLMSSSSSSSDDEFIVEKLLLNTTVEKNRVQNFLQIIDNYTEEEFREQFRVQKATADNMVHRFEESVYFKKKDGGGGRKEVSAKCQIYMLWFAGNKNSYREVANLFGVAVSSTYRTLTNVLVFFFEISPNYIKFPSTAEEKLQAVAKFEQIAGFPNVLGCIDGCYIYIRKPANKVRSTYVNRHDLLSLTIQGICDSESRYIDVFVGAPNKIHDSRVFQLSFISKELPQICGTEYHILGDAAYPLREYLMTPYTDTGNMTVKRKKYNKKLSQTRVKIENSFAFLKTRFRQLMRLDFHTVERMCKFILACTVLHNICIDGEDRWTIQDAEINEVGDAEIIPMGPDNTLQRAGEIKRNAIADRF